jgi:opacity protein-like surface antigen
MFSLSARLLIAAGVLSLVAFPSAQAQRRPAGRPVLVGIGGGSTFPMGTFGADIKSGFNVGGFVQFRSPESLIGLRGEVQYHRNDMKESMLFEVGADPGTTGYMGTLFAGLSGVLEAMPRDASMGWYLLAGGGVYRVTPTISTGAFDVSSSETRAGFNAGAGLRFRAGAASLYIESRYHGLKLFDDNFTFLPISVGVAF